MKFAIILSILILAIIGMNVTPAKSSNNNLYYRVTCDTEYGRVFQKDYLYDDYTVYIGEGGLEVSKNGWMLVESNASCLKLLIKK